MTTAEVLERLRTSRAVFDDKLAKVPRESLSAPIPGSAHTVKEIVAHASAYDELVVERLVASRHGATTALDRDRTGWEAFNERIWRESADRKAKTVLQRADEIFEALMHEVGALSDGEIQSAIGATAALDRAWLEGRAPWQLIAIDCYDHYPAHYAELDAAACQA